MKSLFAGTFAYMDNLSIYVVVSIPKFSVHVAEAAALPLALTTDASHFRQGKFTRGDRVSLATGQ